MTSHLDADVLKRILIQGSRALETKAEAINALNVFPVPDGDTGTNMLLTMKALEQEVNNSVDLSPSQLVATMAKGALWGARGNSGVILAQFFQGLARGLDGQVNFDGRALATALKEASAAAYRSVGNPVEGTMLTVIREVSEAAMLEADNTTDIVEIWEAMCKAARESVARTPLLLPVLRAAGVVDAGGQGLSILLEGALRGLRGEGLQGVELTVPAIDTGQQGISEAFIQSTEEDLYGYCTQFLIHGEDLDGDAIREQVQSLAKSTVVIGGSDIVRVHIHTMDPGPILSHAVQLGTLSQVSIVSMDEQHEEFVTARRGEQQVQPMGVLAIASGQGLMDLFLDTGASAVIAGGDTMNPSIGEILDAVDDIKAERVIVLPNNSNILPAAQQASSISSKQMEVVQSKSIPQGISALLAFNPQETFESNLAAMEHGALAVISGAVCTAQRDSELEGVKVTQGKIIGLLEREMVVAGENMTDVLVNLLAKAGPEEGSLITLYWGADTLEEDAIKIADMVRSRFQSAEIEVVFGGQPHYNYFVSVE